MEVEIFFKIITTESFSLSHSIWFSAFEGKIVSYEYPECDKMRKD